MKPYCKTFRASKVHKAEDCGICSEDTSGGANHERQQAKQGIRDELQQKQDDDFSECVRCGERALTDVSSCAVACLVCGYVLVIHQ